MKKKFMYIGIATITGMAVLSSYKNGPAAHGLGNRSGSQGTNTCSTGGCHLAESSSLVLQVKLQDSATGMMVTDDKYVPNKTYRVAIWGAYSGATAYSHFGLQASIVNAANANLGTLTPGANQSVQTPTGVSVVEHTAPLAKTGSVYGTYFYWKAPAAGSGAAKVYARLLICNNNDIKSDDLPNSIVVTFNESSTTSIAQESDAKLLSLYPNPSKDRLSINLDPSISGEFKIQIMDINGRIVWNDNHNFKNGSKEISTSSFANGQYVVTISNDNKSIAKKLVINN